MGKASMGKASMGKAVLYARYSTDRQNDLSVDDQIAVCRKAAARDNLTVTEIVFDRAASSASLQECTNLTKLLVTAQQHTFDAVVVESLDRLSRNLAELPTIYQLLDFHGVRILTVNEGDADPVKVTLRALYGHIFLKDMGDKIRRHHHGRVSEGKIPGSIPFGYERTEQKGVVRINDAEAKIVRRIFTDYVNGLSPRAIAQSLTEEGIPAPRGAAHWNYQNFIGGGVARHGVLSNPIYVGELDWLKTRRMRSPTTGKKVKRAGDPKNRVVTPVPHLQIIDRQLWDAAQALRARRAMRSFGPSGKPTRPYVARKAHLLSGLLACAKCGSHMRITSTTRGIPWSKCAAADIHGTCTHVRTYDMNRLQAAVCDGMRNKLMECIDDAWSEYRLRTQERDKQARLDTATYERELNRIQVEIQRVLLAMRKSANPIEEFTAQIDELERERVGIRERKRLAEAESNVVVLHPHFSQTYRQNLDRLCDGLASPAITPEIRIAFRNLVDTIVVHETPQRAAYEITPYIRLGVDMFPATRAAGEIIAENQGRRKFDNGNPVNSGRSHRFSRPERQ